MTERQIFELAGGIVAMLLLAVLGHSILKKCFDGDKQKGYKRKTVTVEATAVAASDGDDSTPILVLLADQ